MRSRRRGARVIRWVGGVSAGAVTLAALAALALMVRLNQGPIRVDALGQRIAAALDARSDDRYAFGLGATVIERSPAGPTLVIDDFSVRSGGQTIVEAPRAEVSIDPLALLTGDVRPRRVQVSNIDINLVVLPDGSISVASGKAAAIPVTPAPSLASRNENARIPRAALLAQAGKALRAFFDLATAPGGAIGAIERIGLKSGRLIVDDRTADRRIVFEDLDVEFDKTPTTTNLVINARGPNGPMSGEAHASGTPGTMRTLDLLLKNLSIDELILAGGVRRTVFDSDMKMTANARFALDPDGRVREANASFGLSPGYLRLDDPDHEPYFIDGMSGRAHWDVANRRIVVEPTRLTAADTHLAVGGTIVPPTADVEGWKVDLALAEPGALAPERPGESILPITDFAIEGVVLPFSQRAVLNRGGLRGPEIDVSLAGETTWSDGLHVKFTGQSGQGPLRALLRVWPSHVAAGMRSWLIGHTHGGTVRGATMSADYDKHALLMMRYNRPPPNETLAMNFTVVNGSVDTLPGLAPITNLDATVKLTGRTLLLNAKSGSVDISPGRKLALLDGVFEMPRNDGSDAVPARISVKASGSVEAAAELLTKDVMRSVAQMPLDPATLRGKLEGRVTADFEVGPAAQSSHSTIEANLTATDFSADKIIGKERLEGATISIVSDAAGLRATGNGRLFGSSTAFELRRPTGQSMTATANLTFDDAARARAGYQLSGVTGPIGARVNAVLGSDSTKAQVELDLTRTGIENGIPGLAKPAGKPARLAFVFDPRGSTMLLDQLTFEGGGASARGTVELSSEGGFQAARFSQIKLSPGDDFRADIQKGADGLKIVMRGTNFDARPFLKFVTRPGAATPGSGGDFDLELKSPIITGFGKQVMSHVDLRLARRASTIRQFTLNGGFGRKPIVASMLRSESNVPQVNIVTPDAGALLAFTDIYQRMDGGALAAVMQMEAGRVTGTLQVQNFTLKDEPALRRLVVEGVPQSQPAQGSKPQPRVDANQIAFDRLQVVFTHAGGRLDLRDGVMNGAMLGLTIEGSVDDARDTLNLSGTYVPAYGINNLFAKIPLVGVFLGGDWNEGLFAVNYHIGGRPAAPELSINPLSAVAPGLLRKVFGALDGTGQRNQSFSAPALPPAARGTIRSRPFEPSASPLDPSGRAQ